MENFIFYAVWTGPSCPTERKDYWIDTFQTKPSMRLNFDSDNTFWLYCFVCLYFQLHLDVFDLRLTILDYRRIYICRFYDRLFFKFVISKLLPFLFTFSRLSYCFFFTVLLVLLFYSIILANVATIITIILDRLFHIIGVTVAILHIRNYSRV